MDLNILRALANRDRYRILRASVPDDMLDQNTVSILGWYGVYFNKYPEHTNIQWDALATLMTLGIQDKTHLELIRQIIQQVQKPVGDDVIANTINQLGELRLAGEVGKLVADYNSGEEIDLTFELQRITQQASERMLAVSGEGWANADILEYLEAEADDSGIDLFKSIGALSERIRRVRPGKNIAIAAPTDAGKTSLLCRIAVDAAIQGQEMYPDRPVLYLVNEGTAEAITPRVYQTALALQKSELLSLARAGELTKRYEAIVGRRDAIRLQNIHGLSIAEISKIIDQHKPFLVITDMTGRIHTSKAYKDEFVKVEQIWNAMREQAAIQDFIHIGTVQVSGDGYDQLHPPMTALQMSRVGIQTTLDLLLIMGCLLNPTLEKLRGFSTPKNKLAKEGFSKLNFIEGWFEYEKNEWQNFVATAAKQESK
jgi:hypothetical protein